MITLRPKDYAVKLSNKSAFQQETTLRICHYDTMPCYFVIMKLPKAGKVGKHSLRPQVASENSGRAPEATLKLLTASFCGALILMES